MKKLSVLNVQTRHFQDNRVNFSPLSMIIFLISMLMFTLTPGLINAFTLSNNIPQKYYLDNDGDGKGGPIMRAIYVDGMDLPPVLHQFSNTYVLDNGDCDDNNELFYFDCSWKKEVKRAKYYALVYLSNLIKHRGYQISGSEIKNLEKSLSKYFGTFFVRYHANLAKKIFTNFDVSVNEQVLSNIITELLRNKDLIELISRDLMGSNILHGFCKNAGSINLDRKEKMNKNSFDQLITRLNSIGGHNLNNDVSDWVGNIFINISTRQNRCLNPFTNYSGNRMKTNPQGYDPGPTPGSDYPVSAPKPPADAKEVVDLLEFATAISAIVAIKLPAFAVATPILGGAGYAIKRFYLGNNGDDNNDDDNNKYPFCPYGKCGDLTNPCDNVDGDKIICQIEWNKMVQKSIEAYKRKKEERINPSPQNNPKGSSNSTSPKCLNDGIGCQKPTIAYILSENQLKKSICRAKGANITNPIPFNLNKFDGNGPKGGTPGKDSTIQKGWMDFCYENNNSSQNTSNGAKQNCVNDAVMSGAKDALRSLNNLLTSCQ